MHNLHVVPLMLHCNINGSYYDLDGKFYRPQYVPITPIDWQNDVDPSRNR